MADAADMDGAAGTIWWLYMIECRDGGIYTRIAIDVDLRYEKLAYGKGARYTRINWPMRPLLPASVSGPAQRGPDRIPGQTAVVGA